MRRPLLLLGLLWKEEGSCLLLPWALLPGWDSVAGDWLPADCPLLGWELCCCRLLDCEWGDETWVSWGGSLGAAGWGLGGSSSDESSRTMISGWLLVCLLAAE